MKVTLDHGWHTFCRALGGGGDLYSGTGPIFRHFRNMYKTGLFMFVLQMAGGKTLLETGVFSKILAFLCTFLKFWLGADFKAKFACLRLYVCC